MTNKLVGNKILTTDTCILTSDILTADQEYTICCSRIYGLLTKNILATDKSIVLTVQLFFCLLQLTNTIKPYVVALMQGMPQKCKLPLYEYGSKGVLGFYQAQLISVTTYRDLQTDVFQAFKEIGNTVLFCLQLEKALVGVHMCTCGVM